MKIGDTIYLYNGNKRVYTNDDGTKSLGPNPRYHFVPYVIVDETPQSWVIDTFDRRTLINKKTMRVGGYLAGAPGIGGTAYTAEEMTDALWRSHHRDAIVRLVEHADVAVLRQIAALLGYEAARAPADLADGKE